MRIATLKCGAFVLCGLAISMGTGCGDPAGPEDGLPRQLSVVEQEIVTASNDFTFRLLRRVLSDERLGSGNVFLSPFSASMALGMAMNGAAGETYEEMRSTLGFDGLDESEINQAYDDLARFLLERDGRVELRIGNSVWADEGTPFEEPFFQRVRDYFGASVHDLDLDAPDAPAVINDWVSRATDGRIEHMIEEIPPSVVMLLFNAVYFKGEWTTAFDPAETDLDAFYLEGAADPVQVSTMHNEDRVAWGFGGTELDGVEIPYGSEAFTMVVIMPPRGASLDEFLRDVDVATWERWLELDRIPGYGVYLPTWEMEFEAVLNESLIDLGMHRAFEDADFSRLTSLGVSISRVRQKTLLRVDEEGTEAAAVTEVDVSISGAPYVHVDRPFLVAIRERHSGAVLFIGVVRDPR